MILSIFPGIDLLGMAFEEVGWTVVRGPDPIWGGDIRSFPGDDCASFDAIIGGDPCQAHSTLSNLLKSKGQATRFGDLSQEFQRVVEEIRPMWFLRENIERAPDILPSGYRVQTFCLDNAWLGQPQNRRRKFQFGLLKVYINPYINPPELIAFIPHNKNLKGSEPSATGRHWSNGMGTAHPGNPPKHTSKDIAVLQGLPEDFLKHSPFKEQEKRRLLANGVPLPMGRAIAQGIRALLEDIGAT